MRTSEAFMGAEMGQMPLMVTVAVALVISIAVVLGRYGDPGP